MKVLSNQVLSQVQGGANIITDTWSAIFSDGLTNSEIGLLGFGAVGGFLGGVVITNQSVITIMSTVAMLGGSYLAYEWYFDTPGELFF